MQVDDYGDATIRDEDSTNGTYVNDDRVLPGIDVRLVDGDRVRLAADVTGAVSLPQGEPYPSVSPATAANLVPPGAWPMPHFMLSWPDALIVAGCLAAVAVASRVPRRRTWTGWNRWGGVAQEAGLLCGLYGLWQFAGSFTVMSPAGALPRARWLCTPSSCCACPARPPSSAPSSAHPLLGPGVQPVLRHPALSRPGRLLIWLYARHRARYPRIRTTVALFTGACLLIQFIPVAPPRLLPGTGMVDTAAKDGQSVQPGTAGSTLTSCRRCRRCTWGGR